MNKQLILLLTFISCLVIQIQAQRYPIQVSTLVTPPYPLSLSDYVEAGTNYLQVNIMPNDINLVQYKAKLKLVIESFDGTIRIETAPGYLPAPLFLDGAIPVVLSGSELQPWFDLRNLVFTGLSKSEYQRTRRLPEGYYRIGFQIIDYNRASMGQELVVSNYGSSLAALFLNDPPILNLPVSDAKLELFEPQQIIFQWTPRHKGSPNAAFTTEYVFRLYEVWGNLTNPDAIVRSQQPIFETVVTNNRLVYGIAEPALVPGKKYVWTVQAREINQRSLFRNDGMSQAFIFQYADGCKNPEALNARAVAGPGIELGWTGSTGHSDYVVEYRPKGSNQLWFDQNTLMQNTRIFNLQWATTYQYRVKALCGSYESTWSPTGEIATLDEVVQTFQCGTNKNLLPITNQNPKLSLQAGDVFYAGGFVARITSVSGSNGVFSGECMVTIPFYASAKVKHTFQNIKINDQAYMYEGKLMAVMDMSKLNAFTASMGQDEVRKNPESTTALTAAQLEVLFDADTTLFPEGTIEEIYIDPQGQLVIVDSEGNQTIYQPAEEEVVLVQDESGNQYLVQNGTVTTAPAALAAAAGSQTEQQVSNLDSALQHLPLVYFTPASQMQYGYDSLQHTELAGQYTHEILREKEYTMPYKAIASGSTDYIEAILPADKNFDASQISFSTPTMPVPASPSGNGNNKLLNLMGTLAGQEDQITASITLADTAGNTRREELGRINLVTYDKSLHKVYIVPVDHDLTDIGSIKQTLKAVYGQAVAEWDVIAHPRFNLAQEDWDVHPADGIFEANDADNRMDYSREQKALYRAFKSATDPESDAYYVFVLDKPTNQSSLGGYAIFGKQWVFVYQNQTNNLSHTIAHELGHAAFYLRHTFSPDNQYFIAQGRSQNLMDYTQPPGGVLNKYQWDAIHNPGWHLGWFDKEEDAAMMIVVNIAELNDFKNSDGSFTFLTPAGKLITLPPTISEVYFSTGDNWEIKEGCTGFSLAPIGTLTHFVIKKDNKETKYRAKKQCGSDNFIGYRDDSDTPYKDEISYNLKPTKYIIGTPCLKESAVMFKAMQATESTTPNFEQVNYGSGALQPFDYIVSKINWQNTAKYINAKMSPALGQEAYNFIYSREKSAQDNNILYPYIFTHAHQINQYPEVYRMCWMGKALNNDDFDNFLIKMIAPKDGYGNTTGNTLQTALNYWKEKGYSTYYEYNQVLEQFKNLGTQKGATILELLNKTKDYSCLWQSIKAEGRINAIKKLVFEVHLDGEEEQLLIDLLNTVPDQTQAQTLYNDLQNDNSGLLAELDKSIDGANHVKYYTALSNLLVLAKGKTELQNQINALETLTANRKTNSLDGWAKEKLFFWLSPTFVQSFLNGNRKLLYEDFAVAQNGQVTFTIEQIGLAWSLGKYPVSLKPLDLVRVDFKTSSEALNTSEGNSIYIPAISLSILANEQWKQEMGDAINVGFIIGTAGSGALAQGGRTALIAAGEIMLTGSAMVIDSYRDDIKKMEGGQTFLTAFDVFNTVLLAYQATKVVASLPGSIDELKDAYNSFKSKSTLSTEAAAKVESQIAEQITKAEKAVDDVGIKQINGRYPINANDAGKTLITKSGYSVNINKYGFPDFAPYSKKTVKVDGLTGNNYTDFSKANEAAGFGSGQYAHETFDGGKYKDYTWHHHEDGKTLQLVPKQLNNPAQQGLNHTGGAAIIRHNNTTGNTILTFPSPQ